MTKIIRLTESDLTNIVRRVIEEQMNAQVPLETQMTKIRPEMGGKYCFGNPQRVKSNYGNNVMLYKVKSGDTLGGIVSKFPNAGSVDEIISTNKGCALTKGLKGGDVLALVVVPSE